MNIIKRSIASLLLIAIVVLILPFNMVSAKGIHYSSDFNELDRYVIVQNNQYVLDLPRNITLSYNVKQKAELLIQESNKNISKNSLTVNTNTKEASMSRVQSRDSGVSALGGVLTVISTTVGRTAALYAVNRNTRY